MATISLRPLRRGRLHQVHLHHEHSDADLNTVSGCYDIRIIDVTCLPQPRELAASRFHPQAPLAVDMPEPLHYPAVR